MDSFRALLFATLCVSGVFAATYLAERSSHKSRVGKVPDAGLDSMLKRSSGKRNRAATSVPVDTSQTAVANLIIAEANRLRRIPQASNMQELTWDPEIQTKAQSWANNCVFQHPSPADTTSKYSLGQNIAANAGSSGPMSWNDTFKMWNDEVNQFQYGVGPNPASAVVGHYTQLVWATTKAIACGYKECGPGTQLSGMFGGGTAYFYVCDFGPAGNMMSSLYTPYQQGTKCSSCGATDTCDNGLCNSAATGGATTSSTGTTIPTSSTKPSPTTVPPKTSTSRTPSSTSKTSTTPPTKCPYTNYYSNCGVDVPNYPALFPASILPAVPNGCATVPAYLVPYITYCKATCNCVPGTFAN